MRWAHRQLCVFRVACVGLGAGWAGGEEKPRVDILAPARTVLVEREGRTQAYPSLADAMAAAQTGDVIRLGPGTHRGPVVLDRAGVTLRGEPGARIDANDPSWTPRWEKAPQKGHAPLAAGTHRMSWTGSTGVLRSVV
jgi:hypothetical protein